MQRCRRDLGTARPQPAAFPAGALRPPPQRQTQWQLGPAQAPALCPECAVLEAAAGAPAAVRVCGGLTPATATVLPRRATRPGHSGSNSNNNNGNSGKLGKTSKGLGMGTCSRLRKWGQCWSCRKPASCRRGRRAAQRRMRSGVEVFLEAQPQATAHNACSSTRQRCLMGA